MSCQAPTTKTSRLAASQSDRNHRPVPSWPSRPRILPVSSLCLSLHIRAPALPRPSSKKARAVQRGCDTGRTAKHVVAARARVMRDLEEFRGSGPPSHGGEGGAGSVSWWSDDPEAKRRRRVAGYKAYAVEARVKASLRRGLRWIKDRCTGLVRRH
ncbi:uncharacterized protein LOC133915068 [Phragmites australis]|uniref:uncharacterized protein LOC133915068 n=1 Tax=Phragmites australis TaxID=29695 RepID=UPI002D7737C9|nr:uncharacterized protein LOC133915068 [Phragmites australis]